MSFPLKDASQLPGWLRWIAGQVLPELAAIVLTFLEFLFVGGDACAVVVETLFEIGNAAVVRLQEQFADDVDAGYEQDDHEALAGEPFQKEARGFELIGSHGRKELAAEDQWTVQLVPL